MNINILAGGPEDLLPNLTVEEGIWIGVDRGVFTLLKKGITPDLAFGDFDSVSEAELKEIEQKVQSLRKFKPEKDETDMELALNWALDQNPASIKIFGFSGGRLDHLLANIQLLVKPLLNNQRNEVSLIDNKNEVFLKSPGSYKIAKLPDKKYISFIPVTLQAAGITLEGFKYPLNNCHISLGSTLCISNELIDDYGTFSFSEGILIVVRSRD
jgi:thiamine pyrophosphokinase